MAKNESYSVKHEIIDAVMQLMTEKNYMDITVTDIVKKAGVARASFYRNFNSINDVIDVIVDEISDELIGDIFPTLYSSDERKWREFLFNHFYRFTRKQQQMGKIHPQNLNVLFARMDNKMQQKESNFPAETIRDKYIAIGTVGLINSITKKWMDSGAKETPEEMIDFIMSLFFSVKK
ncbi:MAG: TetR/AcrR family transcriptional regulator [Bacteroidaceae bacterium]|nr:TetR/AcrR family transcriptional regulator [Bacteroidaceae bacterium]